MVQPQLYKSEWQQVAEEQEHNELNCQDTIRNNVKEKDKLLDWYKL